MMKGLFFLVLGIVMGAAGVWGGQMWLQQQKQTTEIVTPVVKEKPLEKYAILNLERRSYESSLVWDETLETTKEYTKQRFHFDSDRKRVNGLATLPTEGEKFPVIVQFRGYADPAVYYPGYGTGHSAEQYVRAGFAVLAPDFLGYGDSDNPASDVWEARFETYTTALNLLQAVSRWEMSDGRVGIWGHSNGGQIALTVLEATGKNYPTVLWAPMVIPFPYSVIYYMDENGEGDRDLRLSLSEFEKDYDYKLYNPLGYLERITATLQIHQGTADEAIPAKWADFMVRALKDENPDLEVNYYKYPGADHNFLPIANWQKVVERDIDFFDKELE